MRTWCSVISRARATVTDDGVTACKTLQTWELSGLLVATAK